MMSKPKMEDLWLFEQVTQLGSFAAVARSTGQSPAQVAKRMQTLEATLKARLLRRQARHLTVTPEGLRVYHWARHLLAGMEDMLDELDSLRSQPRGLLRMACSSGFGRCHVAPLVAGLIAAYPDLQVRLESVEPLQEPTGGPFDLEIRVGNDLAPHLVARKLVTHHRVLCASPDYLARRGRPTQPADLAGHECLVIRTRDQLGGVWRLTGPEGELTVKVEGALSSNQGAVVRDWALRGQGIMLRSMWDVAPLLQEGALIQVLPDLRQQADIWAVHQSRLAESARLRVCMEWFQTRLQSLAS